MYYMISLTYQVLRSSCLLSPGSCLKFCDPEDAFNIIRQSENVNVGREAARRIPNDCLYFVQSGRPQIAIFYFAFFIYLMTLPVGQAVGLYYPKMLVCITNSKRERVWKETVTV